MQANKGSRGIAPVIFNLGTRYRQMVNFKLRPLYSWGREPLPIKQEAGLAPEPIWSLWTREKSLIPTKIQTPDQSLQPTHYTNYAPLAHLTMNNNNNNNNQGLYHKLKSVATPFKILSLKTQ
jgi:hypothetical protein